MLPWPWYRERWARRGLVLADDLGPRLGESLLRTGRPCFVDRRQTRLLTAYPSYAFGVTRRVLPPGSAPPPPQEVAAINREIYRGFDLDYPPPRADDEYAAVAHHRYAEGWVTIANLLAAGGDRKGADDALELARALLPTAD
jgi:hypothetical protein